ncbi:MAG: efflux RND transporter permease subunit [Bdellovibrio sp.]|nr:efflux RND transporter permease subunit [Bdellovibrio sp.]
MILKYLTKIAQARRIVFTVLMLPVVLAIFFSNYKFNIMPESPYLEYTITIEAPGMTANEIERKVTIVAEKVMNGLPALLVLESATSHEKAVLNLKFKAKTKEGTTFLFIQEKIDRLKILLPSEAKRIIVSAVKQLEYPDIVIQNPNSTQVVDLSRKFAKYKKSIRQWNPNLDDDSLRPHFQIVPDLDKILQHGLGIDSVWKALKINSFTYNLGQKQDLVYFVSGTFQSVAQVESVVIGAKGTFLIRIGDVARVSLIPAIMPETVKVWLDHSEVSSLRFYFWAKSALKDYDISFPFITAFLDGLSRVLLAIVALVVLQLMAGHLVFKNYKAQISFLVLDGIVILHYPFWLTVMEKEISLIDFPAMLFTIILTSFFWIVLQGRIRSYYFPSKLHTYIRRQLPQAVLFTLAEYLPTVGILLGSLLVLMLPLLLTDINVIAQFITLRFLVYGVPLTFVTLIILALFAPLQWVIKSGENLTSFSHVGKFTIKTSAAFGYIVIVLLLLSPLAWRLLNYGIKNPASHPMVSHFRGHGDVMIYQEKSQTNSSASVSNSEWQISPVKSLVSSWLARWEVTPQGLSLLPGVDLTSFKFALADFFSHATMSVMQPIDYNINVALPILNAFEFSKLSLAQKDKNALPLSIITNQNLVAEESYIFRSQLDRRNEKNSLAEMQYRRSLPLMKIENSKDNTLLAPFSAYLASQFEDYKRNGPFALLFLFILLALYLNSFYRAGILLSLGMISNAVYPFFKVILQSSFHLDSLWPITLPMWATLAAVLLVSRSIDTERGRGNDRDEVLREAEMHIYPTIRAAIIFLGSAVFLCGAIDRLFISQGQNFFLECMGLGLAVLVMGHIGINHFFRLYYLVAQIFLERQALKVILLYYRFRAKGMRK